MRKFLLILLTFYLIILITACGNEPSLEVKTEKVSAADGALTLTHGGKISFSSEVMVYSNISGDVVEKYFKDGDDVEAGQLLFRIGSKEAESELLDKKKKLTESMTALAKEKAAKNPVAELEADIAELQKDIALLEEAAEAGKVFAPIAGQMAIDNLRLGAAVKANETVLAKIGSINPAVVRFEVTAAEKNFLQASNPKVTLKFADGATYNRAGTLKFINDTTAEAAFDNPEGLLLLNNDVELELAGVNVGGAVLVPESAIKQRDGENFVSVVENNKAVTKKVSIGGKAGNQFIVSDGLTAGDSVIVESSPLK